MNDVRVSAQATSRAHAPAPRDASRPSAPRFSGPLSALFDRVDALVPASFRRQHPADLARAQLWVSMTILGALAGAAAAVDHLVRGPRAQGVLALLIAAGCVALIWVFRRTGRLALVASFTIMALYVALVAAIYVRGGAGAPAAFTLGLIPMLAVFTIGRGAGLWWTAITLATLTGFVVASAMGVRIEIRVPPESIRFGDAVLPFPVLLATVALAFGYEWYRTRETRARLVSEARLQALLAAVPDSMLVVDERGLVAEAHLKGEASLWDGPVAGRPLAALIDIPVLPELVQQVLRTREAVRCEWRPRDGQLSHLEARVCPHDRGHVLVVLRDVSESRLLAQQLVSAEAQKRRAEDEAQMMRADRMASLGQLAAGVSHEINNPLAFIIGNIEYARGVTSNPRLLAALDAEDREDLHSALDDALDGAERVRRIVADLSTYSRRNDEMVQPVRLADAVDSALKLVGHSLRHRATIAWEERTGGAVLGDDTWLVQVFVNLLMNAAQAFEGGDATTNHITMSVRERDGQMIAEIRDNGAGMAPEVLERACDPFFTTKEVGQGTGLGLAVTKNIINRYGGRLGIDSAPGAGTTVRVTFPATRADLEASAADHPPPAEHLSPRRILVVDDDDQVCASLRRMLRDHDVSVVASAASADRLLADETGFDLILCDVMMPDRSGPAWHQQLSETHAHLARRVVFMSAGVFADDAEAYLRRAEIPVLAKPFDPEALASLLRASVAAP